MDPAYDGTAEPVGMAALPDEWDDPAIGTYLERSRRANRERINTELARIDDELAARDTLHDDLVTELEWHVDKYERELDRLATPFDSPTDDRDRVTTRLRDLRQEIREERRQHWQDRQQLMRERRALLRERAALRETDLSQLL